MTYNIEQYTPEVNRGSRAAFREMTLRVGEPAPDLPLWDSIDGSPTSTEQLAGDGHLFLIFGCWTAPPCLYEARAIDALAASAAADGSRVAFVYTREIHPGERLPAHRSMEEKLDRARAFRTALGLRLPVLVDSLDGAAHLAFGGLPFMAVGIAADGTIVHRAEWVSIDLLHAAVANLAERDRRRAEGEPGRLGYVELSWYLPGFTADELVKALAAGGPSAVGDAELMPAPRAV